ncbi:MAG TPA: hypothetical protein VK438_20520 [Xanthobacteraceae bacterium]|nr:hypothetical protein [Xanthobacteraceae bacterium]
MGKPVDPATRLSELLAQSLEELTRPFEPPRPGAHGLGPQGLGGQGLGGQGPGAQALGTQGAGAPHPARPAEPRLELPTASVGPAREAEVAPPTMPPLPAPTAELARADADKALAELEAELFAAARQVDRDDSIPHEEHRLPADHVAAPPPLPPHHADAEAPPLEPVVHDTLEADLQKELAALSANAAASRPKLETSLPEAGDTDASALIAKVRRLMLVSMAVTVIAVGSVFGFIGYRMIKGEGSVEKRADKLPAPAAAPTEVTLSIPGGAKVIQSAVANDRLVLTLDIGGKIEVRTYDVKTLQPAARLNFATTP